MFSRCPGACFFFSKIVLWCHSRRSNRPIPSNSDHLSGRWMCGSSRFSYQGREGKETCVHAECMAQVLIQDRDLAHDKGSVGDVGTVVRWSGASPVY